MVEANWGKNTYASPKPSKPSGRGSGSGSGGGSGSGSRAATPISDIPGLTQPGLAIDWRDATGIANQAFATREREGLPVHFSRQFLHGAISTQAMPTVIRLLPHLHLDVINGPHLQGEPIAQVTTVLFGEGPDGTWTSSGSTRVHAGRFTIEMERTRPGTIWGVSVEIVGTRGGFPTVAQAIALDPTELHNSAPIVIARAPTCHSPTTAAIAMLGEFHAVAEWHAGGALASERHVHGSVVALPVV